jgi:hypothetical protein
VWTGFVEFDLAPIQQYEWIDHVHAKFEDEQKCLQGENDDIGSGALFTSICKPNQPDPDFLSFFFVSPCRNF